MILLISCIVFILGIVLMIRAMRGRLVSNNPHCRNCKFDLVGLELSRDSICPECGKPIVPDTPTIQIGLRKRQPRLVLFAVLLILVGGTGLAWPKVSQMPSIKNIDWYAKFPESLLLKLEEGGSDKALQELHNRLIPGTLSDDGLDKLVDRAFAMQADESIAWDERWGDVLIYALHSEKMTQEQVHQYFEKAFEVRVEFYSEIGRDTDQVSFMTHVGGAERGGSETNFRYQWAQTRNVNGVWGELDLPYQYRVESNLPYKPGLDAKSGGGGVSGNIDLNEDIVWIPYSSDSTGTGSSIPMDLEMDEFDFVFSFHIEIYKHGELFHERSKRIVHHVTRVDHPQYQKFADDPAEVKILVESMSMSPIRIPTHIEEAFLHEDLLSNRPSISAIKTTLDSDHGLLGELFFRVGDQEIPFRNVRLNSKPNSSMSMSSPSGGWTRENSWLNYFIDSQAFWNLALEAGKVDVIYRPRPEDGLDAPAIKSMINVPVIFRDVPVMKIIPKQVTYTDGATGKEYQEWSFRPEPDLHTGVSYNQSQMKQFARPKPVAGEIFEEN